MSLVRDFKFFPPVPSLMEDYWYVEAMMLEKF